jgi:putative tricarboxylic transport membrane protein
MSKEVFMKKADIGAGVGLLLLSIAVFLKAFEYRQTAIYIYGPNFFPQILAVLLGVCAIALIVRAFQGKALQQQDRIDGQGFLRMVLAIGICIGYLLLMQVIGFAFATMVFLFVLMTFLQQQGMVKRIGSSVVVALLVWAIFRYFLVIPIPTGMLPFTF